MSTVQAIILTGEPEAVAKTLREYVGKAPAMAVIQSPVVAGTEQPKGEVSDNPLVEFIKRVLTRADLAPRHTQLLKTLYEAGDAGMMRPELVKALDITTNEGIKGVIGPLGRRVARTPGHDEMAAADPEHHSASGLLLKFQRINNDTHYSLRPETRQALEELHMV